MSRRAAPGRRSRAGNLRARLWSGFSVAPQNERGAAKPWLPIHDTRLRGRRPKHMIGLCFRSFDARRRGKSAGAGGGQSAWELCVTSTVMQERHLVSHAEAGRLLRRAGYPPEQIEDLLRGLPDPIDTERDAAACFERGLSVGSLMDRMGGSP